MKKEALARLFLVGLFLAVLVLSFMIIQPFFTAIIAGVLLAYISFPLFTWLQKKIKGRSMSALIVSVVVIFAVSIPSFLVLNHLTQQAQSVYLKTKEHLNGGFIIEQCVDDSFVCQVITQVEELFTIEEVKSYIAGVTGKAINFLTERVAEAVFNLPMKVLLVFLAIFTMFYALRDGKEFAKRIVAATPLRKRHQTTILKQFNDVTAAVIFGSIIIALVQGILATFGFWVVGISGFLWWGLITMFFALIPFIGAWIVWFPASLYLAVSGYVGGETAMMFSGIFLFFYGLLVVSTVDNFLKPMLVAGRAKVHPLLILFGVIGGILSFGMIGVFVGPILLGLLQTLFQIFEKEMR